MFGEKKTQHRSYRGILLDQNTDFAVTEAFKNIRTGMLYTANSDRHPVYGVTSAFSGAGKSSVIANIAISFAQLGKKTLLIDCDMRAPTQHKIFKTPNREGLSELLAGIVTDPDSAVVPTGYDHLSLVTSGRIPPNPVELLASDNFGNMIDCFKQEFDCIFLDLPPVGVVSDALVASKKVQGFVFVVRADTDDRVGVKESLKKLEHGGAAILGFVLNDVDIKKGNSYYSGYGHDEK